VKSLLTYLVPIEKVFNLSEGRSPEAQKNKNIKDYGREMLCFFVFGGVRLSFAFTPALLHC